MIEIENGLYERDGFRLAMNFAVGRGKIISIIGPSGAGKSTLLNVIAGFEPLSEGRLLLDGADMSAAAPSERPVTFVFQDNNSFAHLSARDNVALGIAPSLRLSSVQWSTVDTALNRVGLAHLTARKPGDMSGGERQRIALARVLVRQKPILLLDEAFAALGPALRQDMLNLVADMQREQSLTVLMVTHHPEDAQALSGEVMFIDDNSVRQPMPTAAFFTTTDPDIRRYLGPPQR